MSGTTAPRRAVEAVLAPLDWDSYIRARVWTALNPKKTSRRFMAKKAVLYEQDYLVSDGNLRLSVVVGERQFGSSIVFLDDDLLGNGVIEELPVGKGQKLDGKTLVVYTLVTDVRENTDEMSVTWILAGGENRAIATATGAASKKFGSQMFKAVFQLKAA